MQRKIFDPEHAEKQQIWQLAEKGKIIHTKAFSRCPSQPIPWRGQIPRAKGNCNEATCLLHTAQYAQEIKKSGDAM